jgi:uncharacterized membrane protein YeiB
MTIAARLAAYGSTRRILGVDLARGLAVLGMFGAHVGVRGELGPDPRTWLAIVDGRSSILFALLAGVSIAIISGRMAPPTGVELLQARTRILTRAVVIFAIGGILQFLGTNVAVILPMYALLFVLSLPFLRWRPRNLFLLAGVLAVVSPLFLLVWNALALAGGQSAIIELFLTGSYPGVVWVVFVLVGLGVGRLDLASRRVAGRVALAGVILVVVGYGAGLAAQEGVASQQPVAAPVEEAAPPPTAPTQLDGADVDLTGLGCDAYADDTFFCYPEGFYDAPVDSGTDQGYVTPPFSVDVTRLASIAPHSGTPFEVIGSTGFALLVLGLSLLVARRARWVLYPFIAVGAMALTAYSAHLVVLALIGQGAYTQPDNWLYLAFILGALVFCSLWTLLFGRGPLERLLSRVSRQAARLTPPAALNLTRLPDDTKAD